MNWKTYTIFALAAFAFGIYASDGLVYLFNIFLRGL